MPENRVTWGHQLYLPSEGRCAVDFYCPWLGLNLQTLGLVASTLVIMPLRTTWSIIHPRQTFEVLLYIRKLMCYVPLLLHE
jgi:hypothetical protein